MTTTAIASISTATTIDDPSIATHVPAFAERVVAAVPFINAYADARRLVPDIVYGSTADQSSLIQLAINLAKGRGIVFTGDVWGRDIKLADSTYTDTRLVFEGRLHMPGDGLTNTPGLPVPAALFIGAADGVTLIFRGHGERSTKGNRQQISMLMLAGATNLHVPLIDVRECRGDGVYVSHLGSGSLGAICKGVQFDRVVAVNSASDGRNAMSIIAGSNILVKSLHCDGFGVMPDGAVMPGGFDAEPDHDYETIDSVTVERAYIRTVGQAGFALHGRATRSRNMNGHDITVENYAASNSNDGNAAATQNYYTLFKMVNCVDSSIRGTGRWTNTYGTGIVTSGNLMSTVDVSVSRCNTAAECGVNANIGGVAQDERCDIVVRGSDISRYGYLHGSALKCRFGGEMSSPSSAYYLNRFGAIYDGVISDCTFQTEIKHDPSWTRAHRHNAATYSGCTLQNTDLTAFGAPVYGVDATQMTRANVRGITDMAAMPTSGSWVAGQYVRRSGTRTPTANGNVLDGWERLTTGGGNVLNTDWRAVYIKTTDTV